MAVAPERSGPVVFFGSGPVAAKSLELLLKHTRVEAVITKPTTLWEMASIADEIPVHTASTQAELDQLVAEHKFASQLGVLIDFGIIVSQDVIGAFPLGIINSHFSILPEWRGADPITFALLSGQDMTGVSLMLLVQKMDEGPIVAYGEQSIAPTDTTPTLTQKLIHLSDGLLRVELPRYMSGQVKAVDQAQVAEQFTHTQPSYSRKLTKDDGILDFSKPAEQLEREIRAYIDWPKCRMTIGGKDVIITAAHAEPTPPALTTKELHKPGDIEIVKETKSLFVHCKPGKLYIDQLKPAGKGEMPVAAFLAGYQL